MLKVERLSYGYTRKKEVLHDISFSLKPGITLLIGENGSGKSTLLKILTGSIPTAQPFLFDGEIITDIQRKRRMAYLPQELDVFPSLKVEELLRFVAEAKGVPKNEVKNRVNEAAKLVNVDNYLNCKVKRCSVGTKRRVGIAMTLLGNPDIVILDEPTAGVDPKERNRFYHTIRECYTKKTVLIATHILDDVQILADNVLMISDGRIVFDGTFHEFYHALDGHVYQVKASDYLSVDSQEANAIMVLSEVKQPDGVYYHIFMKDSSVDSKYEIISPTLEDIWECYHRGYINV